MPSVKIPYANFQKLSNYIVNTGAGAYNLPRRDMDALYGPGFPIAPATMPADSELPREFDYPVGINYTLQPRIGYETLFDVNTLQAAYLGIPEVAAPVNLIIRLLCGFNPYFRYKATKQRVEDGYEFNHLLIEPEKDIPFNVWMTKFKKSSKIFSAPAYYKKFDRPGGTIQEMEYLDGSTLFLIINSRGKLPQPNEVDPELLRFIDSVKKGDRRYLPTSKNSIAPFNPSPLNKSDRYVPFDLDVYLQKAKRFTDEGRRVPTTPAFTQIIKGVPFSFWDRSQVYFMPEPPYPATNTPYGETFIERAWPWINVIALLVAFELGHYRSGNMPEGVFTIPREIAPNLGKLAEFEKQWNARMAEGSQVQHARNRFMFDGSKWFSTKKPDWQKELYAQANNEILYAIGVPPAEMGDRPNKGLGGKGFEEGAENTMSRQLLESEKKGIETAFTKALMDSGEDKVECYLDYPAEQIDPAKQADDLQNDFVHGLKSMNDILTAQNKELHGDGKDKENPWNWHFMIVGNSFYVLEKLKIDQNGLAQPSNGGPAQPQAGASPFDPERALAGKQERPAQVQNATAQKLMRDIENGNALGGVTYYLPLVKGFDNGEMAKSAGAGPVDDLPSGCDPVEFAAGMKEEQEHADTVGGSQAVIRRIVLDHLREDPKYYSHLKQIGKSEQVDSESPFRVLKADITDHDGAMVAVFIPDKVAKQLRKIADGLGLPKDARQELAENMHVTLAFLPDTDQAKEESARVLGCIQSTALGYAPLKGNVQGYGVFNGKDGEHVLFATLDIPDLPFIRTEICNALDKAGIAYAKDHGFVPHITLAYFPDDWELPAGFSVPDIDCEIDGITFALGDKLTTITLQEGDTRLGKRNLLKVDWPEYFKHCGVCPEDAAYFGAPIEKENVKLPDAHHANGDMEFVAMKPKGLKPLPALWKPEGGEDDKLNERIDGHQCPREEVAWLIDQALGFHLVPVAYTSELEGERGVALWFVQSPPVTDPKPVEDYGSEWIERMGVLDTILCNLDRPSTSKNRLTHPDDPTRVMAIDNSLSCSPNAGDKPKSVFTGAMGRPLSAPVVQAIKNLLADHATWQDVEDVLAEWDGDSKAKAAVQNMQDRAQGLLGDVIPEEKK